MSELGLLSVFLVGLLGGVHCVGMCGGIVSAFSLQHPGRAAPVGYLLAYNSGRIGSYGLAGIIAGTAGAGGMLLNGLFPAQQALYLIANLLLIALGLYLAGLWRGLASLERVGGPIWRRLQPYTRRLLPIDSPGKAFLSGTLWGWLPCGLVYSILVTAFASGSALNGGLVMLAFGLGTLPNLLAMGLFAQQLQRFTQRPGVRLSAGLIVIGFGLLGIVRAGHLAQTHGAPLFCLS